MASDFETALETGDIAALRAIPKADLHNHAIGGGNRDFVREKTGVDIAPIDQVLHSMDEMHEWAGKHTGQAFKGPHGRMIGIGVNDEFLALYRAGVFTAAELDQIRLNGLTDQPLRR